MLVLVLVLVVALVVVLVVVVVMLVVERSDERVALRGGRPRICRGDMDVRRRVVNSAEPMRVSPMQAELRVLRPCLLSPCLLCSCTPVGTCLNVGPHVSRC